MGSVNRNSLCPCGSGEKYKKCCLGNSASVLPVSEVNISASAEPEAIVWEKASKGREQDTQIDSFIIQGYGNHSKQDYAAACEIWARAWDQLLLRLSLKMTTCQLSLPAYDGSFHLENWVQDYCATLHNAALSQVAMAEVGVSFCSGIILQFSDENSVFTENFRASLGEFHFLAGNAQDGENVLLELINDHPNRSVGYAHLSDMMGKVQYNRGGIVPLDRLRAVELLKTALAFPVEDAGDFDLEKRLEDLLSNS